MNFSEFAINELLEIVSNVNAALAFFGTWYVIYGLISEDDPEYGSLGRYISDKHLYNGMQQLRFGAISCGIITY